MLGTSDAIGFVPTTQPQKARTFYEDTLGLTFVEETPYAVVFQAHNATIRVAIVERFEPAVHTILGWNVNDIDAAVRALADKGVPFQRYDMLEQDPLGIWDSPSGARVAWFKDPDGNTLSLTQC